MQHKILVTVICLSYNHADYIPDALASVFGQSYPNIELIVADDCSTDDSKAIIKSILKNHPDVLFLDFLENIGNCKAFNIALTHAKGQYIIDLAADDILLNGCIMAQVAALQASPQAALCFSDAWLSDASGRHIKRYHEQPRFAKKPIPQGYVFKDLFLGQFICPPTVMFDAARLAQIGGYDPQLAYEDFDVWVRLARHFPFVYIDQPLVTKRIVAGSLSQLSTYNRKKAILNSTIKICQKALVMANEPSETQAIIGFMRWHLRLCARLGAHEQADNFAKMIGRAGKLNLADRLALGYLGRLWPIAWWIYNAITPKKK